MKRDQILELDARSRDWHRRNSATLALEHSRDLSKPQTLLGTCLPNCIACAMLRKLSEEGDELKRVQQQALQNLAGAVLRNARTRGDAGGTARANTSRRNLTFAARDAILKVQPNLPRKKWAGEIERYLSQRGTPADVSTIRRHLREPSTT